MKLKDYATEIGVTYKTAYNHFKKGLIKGRQLETGTIVLDNNLVFWQEKSVKNCVLYARVSSSENKLNLDSQLERLKNFALAKGYNIVKEITEIGSGLNDKRRKLTSLFTNNIDYNILIVEHKDRLARFGIKFIEILLKRLGINLEIINQSDTVEKDITEDLISIITSYSAKLYGLRRTKRRTEEIINTLKGNGNKTNCKKCNSKY